MAKHIENSILIFYQSQIIVEKLIDLLVRQQQKSRIIIVGKDYELSKKIVSKINKQNRFDQVETAKSGLNNNDFKDALNSIRPQLLINAAGSFFERDYSVAKACIDLQINYIDIADDLAFVRNIGSLDKSATKAGVTIISGASVFPGLSSVIIDHYFLEFAQLKAIKTGYISALEINEEFCTSLATLQKVGKPIDTYFHGKWHTVYGGQNLHKSYYGDNLGLQWNSYAEVPDLALYPNRYPDVESVVFYAGFVTPILNRVQWILSWLVRGRFVRTLKWFSKLLHKINRIFAKPSISGMVIQLRGTNLQIQPLELNINLIARADNDYYIALLPTVIVANKILKQKISHGAKPCLGLFSLQEFDSCIENLEIYHIADRQEF